MLFRTARYVGACLTSATAKEVYLTTLR